ncbi:Integrator 1 [Carabus blaptoides fortunei]
MIRSTVSRLVDAALINLEPSQLVLFIQSFGIPVSSMSKLLCMLDSAVTVDQTSVGEAVLDKCYMAQLVEVQHRRGATGGNTFVQVLQLQEPKLPDDIIIDTGLTRQPFPEKLLITAKPPITDTNSVVSLMNSIFLNAKYEFDVDKDFGNLLKNLGEEIHNNYISTKKTLKVLTEYFISNVTSSDFVVRLLVNEGYSCTLFRLILSNKYNTTELSDLARNMLNKIADKKCSLAVILTNFLRKQQKLTRVGKDLNDEFSKDTIDVLKKTDLVSLERTTKTLVEKSLERSDNVGIVNAMCKLLLTDVESNKFERTGLLVDWIAELEMEIIGTLPDLQMELLFSKNPVKLSNVPGQHWMSFRPYLLTLLTHRVSWRALHACVLRLLAECLTKYDPSAVLDFLWALTCNPKLWQGRDKFTPKNYKPENVLQLSNQQIIVLVDYILEEACQANDMPPYNDKNSVHKIEQRLPLLLQALGDRTDIMSYVVRHLVATMAIREETDMDSQVINLDDSLSDVAPEKHRSVLAQEFLILLYMRIPKVIHYIPDSEMKNMENVSKITEYSTSIIDKITHSLLTALASTPRSKDWPRKSQEFELLTRKMAAVHPSLVLRQLPMIAASLKGRTHLDFNVFKSRNHLNLFVQILGIVELLQPAVFEEDYRSGLEGVLMAYFFLFRYHGYVKELHSILGKFVSLLQAYVSYDAPRALKYLQRHAHLLNDLHLTYSNLRPLRVLMSSISLPKEENPLIETSLDSGEVLVAVARAPSPEPVPPNWYNLVQGITRLEIDELPNVLQEIDHISNRRPMILESIIEQVCSLILSPASNVRQLGHVLLLRYLRHNPASVDASSPVLAAVLQSLETTNADVINSILEKLPDYVICLQEHAIRILEKAFLLGVKSNISTTANISKAIAVLNIQSGC